MRPQTQLLVLAQIKQKKNIYKIDKDGKEEEEEEEKEKDVVEDEEEFI